MIGLLCELRCTTSRLKRKLRSFDDVLRDLIWGQWFEIFRWERSFTDATCSFDNIATFFSRMGDYSNVCEGYFGVGSRKTTCCISHRLSSPEVSIHFHHASVDVKTQAEGNTLAPLQKHCWPRELSKYGRCPRSAECAWTLKVVNKAIGSKIRKRKTSIVPDVVCKAFMLEKCTLEICIAYCNDGFR